MRIESFSASADLCGRRVWLRWAFVADPGEALPVPPPVVVRRKTRDFEFPASAGGVDPSRLYDSAAFPPAPLPAGISATDLPGADRLVGARRIREHTVTLTEVVDGQRCEVLRETVRTVFAADRSVVRREVEVLDVGGPGSRLEAGVTYYYRLDSPGPGDGQHFRATATPGEVHGYHRTLYELLPEVVRRHDTVARRPDAGTGLLPEASTVGGQLRRFVDVFGSTLDALRSSADGLRTLRDVPEVDQRFLPLLAQWIGWDLSTDEDVARQRNEIRTAPRLYGSVGTVPGLRSVVDHYTGWSTRVAEFTQNVARTNVPPQRNLFAAERRAGRWWGVDEAAPLLGFAPPADRVAGSDGVPATLTGAAVEPFPLRPGMTLTVAVDGDLPATLTFGAADFADVGAATAAEVAAVVSRAVPELEAGVAGRAVRLRSLLRGPASRVEVVAAPASLLSLDGAPTGRPAAAVDDAGRAWLAYAGTEGAGARQSRLHVKAQLGGRWSDSRLVQERPLAAAADPALVPLPDGRLWLAWVEHPGTAGARLRWRRGAPPPLSPARLRGDTSGPFRLVVGSRLTLALPGGNEVFTVRAGDYTDPRSASAEEVAAAMNDQFQGISAAPAADGSLALQTIQVGPDARLRVLLGSSTAARALGLGDRRLAGRGRSDQDVSWGPPRDVTSVGPGRLAGCSAVLDADGAVRLFWSTHYAGQWTLARSRWDGRLLVVTGGDVATLAEDGTWSALSAPGSLAGAEVREVAVDADGSTWFATAAGAAVRAPGGDVTVLTAASTGGGLLADDVRDLALAPDGTAWFALAGGTSARRPDGTWESAAVANGLASDDARAVTVGTDGTVWVGTTGGLSWRVPGSPWRSVRTGDGLPDDNVRQVVLAADDAVWVATAGGAARVARDGTMRAVDLSAAGPGAGEVRAVAAQTVATARTGDSSGPVWWVTGAGLVESGPGSAVRLHPVPGVDPADVRSIHLPGDGTRWLGTSSGLVRQDADGRWQTVPPGAGPAGRPVTRLHGPWSGVGVFPAEGAGDREPHALRVGGWLWLAWSQRRAPGPEGGRDSWRIRVRRCDLARADWSGPADLTVLAERGSRDREPVLVAGPSGPRRVYFRSDRDGGDRLWAVDVDDAGVPGAPARVTAGRAVDSDPAVVPGPGGVEWLVFRSDRNVALGRLGGGVPGAAQEGASRRAPEEAAVRRFAGSTTSVPADLDRNRGRSQFGDLLAYTPQQPGGGRPAPDELYTPATIGLYVDRGRAGRPLVQRDADRLRQLLERFRPVDLRVVVILQSGQLEELVFPPERQLQDSFTDHYPFAERFPPATDATAVAAPQWLVILSGDGSSVVVDPADPTTLRRRTWWPPLR
ncbi:phage tail protein [Geodermatophilus sp. SYSU D00814]